MTNNEWQPWEESWCEKCKTNCCAKAECDNKIMKILKCFDNLKQGELFENIQ